MKKKKINEADFAEFKDLHQRFVEIETWTSEKKLLKESIFHFLKKFQSEKTIKQISFPKISTGKAFLKWDFEFVTVPNDKLGYLFKYRNQSIFIFCIDRHSWGTKELIIIQTKIKQVSFYEKAHK